MLALPRVWTVPAEVLRVVDGDTVRLRLDQGWHTFRDENVRIIGVNAPEVATVAGKAARAFVAAELPAGMRVGFISRELDKYGRPLGELWYPRGTGVHGDVLVSLGVVLVQVGHAVPYLG